MKSDNAAKKSTYIGAGAGLALFAIFGLHPGALVGGVLGIKIAGILLGFPITSELMPRLIVGILMLLGVLVSSLFFVACGAAAGWTAGKVIDSLKTVTVAGYRPNTSYFAGSAKKTKYREKK